MLNALKFSEFPIHKKIKFLYERGTFIVAIRYYNYKVNLYLLNNYYVEVFFNHKLARIEKVELMDASSSRIKFYTDQIKIPPELMKYL